MVGPAAAGGPSIGVQNPMHRQIAITKIKLSIISINRYLPPHFPTNLFRPEGPYLLFPVSILAIQLFTIAIKRPYTTHTTFIQLSEIDSRRCYTTNTTIFWIFDQKKCKIHPSNAPLAFIDI